jgi:hypothetical protein
VGISTVFEIYGHSLFQGDGSIYHEMFFDTRNNCMYGLGVGISKILEILGHFLFQGG